MCSYCLVILFETPIFVSIAVFQFILLIIQTQLWFRKGLTEKHKDDTKCHGFQVEYCIPWYPSACRKYLFLIKEKAIIMWSCNKKGHAKVRSLYLPLWSLARRNENGMGAFFRSVVSTYAAFEWKIEDMSICKGLRKIWRRRSLGVRKRDGLISHEQRL